MTSSLEIVLSPPDNARLANLCGAMDGNITHIARALDVDIRRRGGRFSLRGDSAQEAADLLRQLYARAEECIQLTDVQMEIGGGNSGSVSADAGHSDFVHMHQEARQHRGLFKPRSDAQAELSEKIMQNTVVLCAGPAGTGKTHVALAAALRLQRDGVHERLVLARPAVEAGGERIGFLPGDMEQKVNPYLRPLHDILHRLLGRREAARRMADGRIEMIPMSFMRGLTIDNAVVVLDEAQNTSPAQLKMTLTRLGPGGRLIATGDESQSDLPPGFESGLSDAMRRLHGIGGIAVHRFAESDIVRHKLVKNILRAYGREEGGRERLASSAKTGGESLPAGRMTAAGEKPAVKSKSKLKSDASPKAVRKETQKSGASKKRTAGTSPARAKPKVTAEVISRQKRVSPPSPRKGAREKAA